MQDVRVETASRLSRKGRRAAPIRVQLATLKERNLVLTRARAKKGRVKVVEDFTERTKKNRQKLAEFAKKNAAATGYVWGSFI